MDENVVKGATAAPANYDTYAFLFSCALHKPASQGNLAAAACPKDLHADFDGDGKVSLAEAHYYALSHMDQSSAPQISSAVFARTVAARRTERPDARELASFCRDHTDAISSIIEKIGVNVDPALRVQISARLQMERSVLMTFFGDYDLMEQLDSKVSDPIELIINKLEKKQNEFEEAYSQIQSEIR